MLGKANTEKTKTQYEVMVETPIPNLLVKLAIPAVLSMLVMNFYNLVDTAFVGTLGTSQSGATGIVFSFMAILQAFAFLCGQGAGSLMSRQLGKQNIEKATEYASTGFFLCFFVALFMGVMTFVVMDPLLYMLGSTETILPYARIYVSCIAVASPFFSSSLTLNNLLRYEGKAKLGTVGMLVGAFLNIGLDALLMFKFGMGIAGAGIATGFAQFISFCILLSMFMRGKTQTKISVKYITRDWRVVGDIMATGSPSLIRQGLSSVSGMLLNQCAAVHGDAAVAAFSCVSRISFFTMALAIGIGQGFQPISSFNYGANRRDRVRQGFWMALAGEFLMVFLLSLPMFIFAPDCIRVLRDDPEVIGIGTRALRLLCVTSLCVPLTMMVEMGFQSIGMKLYAIFGSSLRSGVLFIPSLLILPKLRGIAGLQEAQPLSFVLSFFVAVFLARLYLREMRDMKV